MYAYIDYVEVCRGTASPVGSKAQKTKEGRRFHTWYLVQGTKQGTKENNKIVLSVLGYIHIYLAPGTRHTFLSFCALLIFFLALLSTTKKGISC